MWGNEATNNKANHCTSYLRRPWLITEQGNGQETIFYWNTCTKSSLKGMETNVKPLNENSWKWVTHL